MPGSMELFKKIRPKDINLEIAISDKKQVLTYYMFNDSALNGFSRELSTERNSKGKYRIIDEIKLEASILMEVLDTYLPENTEVDFLSIDVERLDFQIIKSKDWNCFLDCFFSNYFNGSHYLNISYLPSFYFGFYK